MRVSASACGLLLSGDMRLGSTSMYCLASGLVVVVVAGCAVGGDEATASSNDALRSAAAGSFSFGNDTNLKADVVPIRGNSSEWRVVYSVELSNLQANERIAVRGEVTLSKCVPSEGAPCRRVTPFDPRFTARVVIGSSANDANGPAISASPSTTCSTRDHHCTLVIGEKIERGFVGRKFANLVVAAEGNGAASSQDIMKVESGHGGIYVTRIGVGANEDGRRQNGNDVSPGWMKIDNVDSGNGSSRREEYVTLRARVDHVQPKDILDINALIEAQVDDGSCDPLIMNQVFITPNPSDDPEAHKLVALTAQNGTNCLDASCRYEKSGAGELPANTPTTVYVSVVSKAGRSCVQSGDRWKLGSGSQLIVRVRR